jgi:hypothetical protein
MMEIMSIIFCLIYFHVIKNMDPYKFIKNHVVKEKSSMQDTQWTNKLIWLLVNYRLRWKSMMRLNFYWIYLDTVKQKKIYRIFSC